MVHPAAYPGFPLGLRLNHYINFLFLTLLVRSGIQIRADHSRLYWNKHCRNHSRLHPLKSRVCPSG